MTDFGDARDWVVQMPHVTHGHATQGNSRRAGPGGEGYALYPVRAQLGQFAHFHDHAGEPGNVFRLFEFGTLNGYALAAVAMANAKYDRVEVGWCDNESTEAGSNEKARENLASLGFDDPFVCVDRTEAALFGRATMVMVDGAHDFENTMLDIAMAALLGPSVITVDDLIPTHPGCMAAFSHARRLFAESFVVPTVNKCGVLSSIPGLRMQMVDAGWQIDEED